MSKVKENKNTEKSKAKKILVKVLVWVGALYGIGMIRVLYHSYYNTVGEFLSQAELLDKIMTVRLIPVAEFIFNPIRGLLVYLPFVAIIIIVPSLVYYFLSKVKFLEKKEVLLITALSLFAYFL